VLVCEWLLLLKRGGKASKFNNKKVKNTVDLEGVGRYYGHNVCDFMSMTAEGANGQAYRSN